MALRGSRSSSSSLGAIASAACAALALLSLATAPAEARGWRHYHYVRYAAHTQAPADPAFAAIVVDANAGRTLYAANENEPRHPASLTKVMTLYLLFEQLDKGAMTMQTEIPVSEHAAAQEPSKLGLEPGDTIAVEDAIKAIVTRSANDVAVAIAEAIGGDEAHFADMMTRKAHALGMSRTLYRNASGLPNDEQITTARDLTILARATEERFPRYFKFYSTHEFEYAGEIIGNHNHLLGRVDGVDGIKTGYTRASGFNLLTSVHRDGRSLIAVVLGGRTAGARDAYMEGLIREHLAQASNRGHTAPMIAEAVAPPAAPVKLASLAITPGAIPAPPPRSAAGQIEEGDEDSAEDATPAPALATATPFAAPLATKSTAAAAAKPVALVAAAPNASAVAARPAPYAVAAGAAAKPVVLVAATPSAPVAGRPAPYVVAAATPGQLGWVKGPDPIEKGPSRDVALTAQAKAATTVLPAAPAKAATTVAAETAPAPADHGGWIIQIGISDDAGKANDLLARARAQNHGTLAQARPFTEKVAKGEDVFYRARFAGLDSASAETACRSLKKSGFACFASRD
jgi:D-alanyl-D-alanine carboxypeptidase